MSGINNSSILNKGRNLYHYKNQSKTRYTNISFLRNLSPAYNESKFDASSDIEPEPDLDLYPDSHWFSSAACGYVLAILSAILDVLFGTILRATVLKTVSPEVWVQWIGTGPFIISIIACILEKPVFNVSYPDWLIAVVHMLSSVVVIVTTVTVFKYSSPVIVSIISCLTIPWSSIAQYTAK